MPQETKSPWAYDPELAYLPTASDTPRTKALKDAGKLLAEEILDQAPEGPHRSLALRHVEDAVWRAVYAVEQETASRALEKARKGGGAKAAA